MFAVRRRREKSHLPFYLLVALSPSNVEDFCSFGADALTFGIVRYQKHAMNESDERGKVPACVGELDSAHSLFSSRCVAFVQIIISCLKTPSIIYYLRITLLIIITSKVSY